MKTKETTRKKKGMMKTMLIENTHNEALESTVQLQKLKMLCWGLYNNNTLFPESLIDFNFGILVKW